MTDKMWGSEDTKYFYELTPDRILDAVEASGLRCTGRCIALNSMENRVYEVEIESMGEEKPKSKHDLFRVVKFYRPGRWSREQIQEEHDFLWELKEHEIPVVPPVKFEDGSTLKKLPYCEILYAIFPKQAGRAPQEFEDKQMIRIGTFLARMHNIGALKQFKYRLKLTPEVYGLANLEFLLSSKILPQQFQERYASLVNRLCAYTTDWFKKAPYIRVHGDCHMGNLLWLEDMPFFLDYDDSVYAPPVQDIWLIASGRDDYSRKQRDIFIDSYNIMREFDYSTLRLIEVLRALRYVHFSAWIGKRWEDPAFPRAFPYYGSEKYWQQQCIDLAEQIDLIESSAGSVPFQ